MNCCCKAILDIVDILDMVGERGSKIPVKCTGFVQLEIIFIIGGLTRVSLLTCCGKDICECQLYHGKEDKVLTNLSKEPGYIMMTMLSFTISLPSPTCLFF
jgi:hypothetical protein